MVDTSIPRTLMPWNGTENLVQITGRRKDSDEIVTIEMTLHEFLRTQFAQFIRDETRSGETPWPGEKPCHIDYFD